MEDIGVRMENSTLLTIFALLIVGYLVLYFGGRHYLETFQNNTKPIHTANHSLKDHTCGFPPESPYSMVQAENPDEYELASVFQHQGSRHATKKQISDAMTRYPMDWSAQGQNSQYFQEHQAQYEKETADTIHPVPFHKEIHGTNMLLPDSAEQEEEEKKILKTYQPKSSKGLLEYSVDDVKGLLYKLYDKKGLIPIVEKSKQGDNVWEIVEVKEKNPQIVWEDEVDPRAHAMKLRGEEVIQVPNTAADLAAGMDPFMKPRGSTRHGKQDHYSDFAPSLQRMFEPTRPIKSWF